MKKNLKIFIGILVLSLVALVAACGGNGGATQAEQDAAEQALETHYEDTLADPAFEVTSADDFTLVNTVTVDGSTYNVSWESGTPTVISHSGAVTRPAYNEDGGVLVELYATIDVKGTAVLVTFNVWVVSLEQTVEEGLTEVLALQISVPASVFTDGITSDYENLPETVTFRGETLTITWSSNDPDHLTADGVVTRPDADSEDAIVVLTASVTFEGTTVTREIQFRINKLIPSELRDSIADAIDGTPGDYVKLLGLTVLGKEADGFFLNDANNIIYVYAPSHEVREQIVIGQTYDFEAVLDVYFGSPQLVHNAAMPLTATPSSAAPQEPPVTETTLAALIDNLVIPTEANPLQVAQYRFTAKVIIDKTEGETSNYDTWLVDPSYEGDTIITSAQGSTATSYAIDEVMNIYYKSNKALFASLHGQIVTVDVVLVGYRSDRNVWYANFLGGAADIQIEIEDNQEAVDTAADALVIPVNALTSTTFELTTTLYGTTISWTSSNEAVINPNTGVVTLVDGQVIDVTLTATITRGDASTEATFEVKVGEVISDIADLYDFSNNTRFFIQGVVTGANANNTITIQDSTGAISLFAATSERFNELLDLVGTEIKVLGTKGLFNGLHQVASGFTWEVIDEDAALPNAVNLNDIDDWSGSALLPLQGQYLTATQLRVLSVSGLAGTSHVNYVFYNEATGERINGFLNNTQKQQLPADSLLRTLAVDTYVDFNAALGWAATGPSVGFITVDQLTASTAPTLTDAQKVNVALDFLSVPEGTTAGNIQLSQTGEYGATVSWTVTEGATVAEIVDGVLVITASTEEIEVVLTYVVTVGTAEVTETTTLTIPGTDVAGTLMIYEIYGGGGNTNAIYTYDYVVLYNGTDAAIDLSTYTLQYTSTAGTFGSNNLNLTGSIAAGGYYLIQLAAGATVTNAPLPVDADVVGDIAVAAANGKFALANSTTTVTGPDSSNVVDFVGFGTANQYEGSGATPAASNMLSVRRKTHIDTNDNASDFETVTPNLGYLLD